MISGLVAGTSSGTLLCKGRAEFAEVDEIVTDVQDASVRKQVARLQSIASRLLDFLEEHPKKIPLAQKFLRYYQNRLKMFLKKYREFEASGVQADVVLSAMAKIRQGLMDLETAYNAEFSHLLEDDIIDIEAELKVMKQILAINGVAPLGGSP